ncbi:hypothetical protein GCM10010176_045430 [Nonomuraea spiralis]|nr:hypothetical protein GCM10010176_045430 [Nonomuraea spiralis]
MARSSSATPAVNARARSFMSPPSVMETGGTAENHRRCRGWGAVPCGGGRGGAGVLPGLVGGVSESGAFRDLRILCRKVTVVLAGVGAVRLRGTFRPGGW